MKRNRICQAGRAFTLVETLMVTSVIALLLSVMLPSFKSAREDARRTVCVANLKHTGGALFTYSADNRDFGPQVMPSFMPKSPRNLLSSPGRNVSMGLMVPSVVPDPHVFLCPSQTEFFYAPDFLALGRDFVGCSYAYAVHIPAGESPRLGSVRHLALVSDDFVSGPDGHGVGKHSHRVGYHVLYTDASAAWYPDPDESIWKRRVYWDREGDNINYASLYGPAPVEPPGGYGRSLDIFRVWHSFCYSQPDPF